MKYLLALLFCFTLAAQQTVNNFTVKTNLTVNGGGLLLIPPFSTSVSSITEPVQYQTFQRNASITGPVYVSGTASGLSGQVIQARHSSGAWQTVGSTDIYGRFSGTITGSVGDGNLDVRIQNAATYLTVQNVRVGDVFAIWGQSNGSGRLTSNQSYTNATVIASIFGNDYTWKNIEDPTDSNSGQIDTISSDSDALGMGSIWPIVADGWKNNVGTPIAFVQCTKGATGFGLTQPSWIPGTNYFDRSTLFGSAMYRIQTVHGVRAILWWQGEGGFDDVTGMSYITPFTNMVTAVQSQFPSLKLVPCKLQQCVGVSNQRLTNGWYAIDRLWNEWPNLVYRGPTLADVPVGSANNILAENEGTGLPYYHIKTSTNGAAAAYRWLTNLTANFQTY